MTVDDPGIAQDPPADLIRPCESEVVQLRDRLEHLERLTLAQAVENEELANENERLRIANEGLSARRGVRAIRRARP